MKAFATENIRNLCLAGQRGCGKTGLADAIAFAVGVNNRIGKVDEESSFFDFTEGEISRKSTLTSKLLACEWQSQKLNLMDCPGNPDFVGEFLSSLKVSDSVGIVIDAASGVEIGTQLQWKQMRKEGLARFFFVNKMEKENTNWKQTLESIKNAFGKQGVAVQLPIGEGDGFKGLVDLLHMKAYEFQGDKRSEVDIPADMQADAEAQRENLIEVAAESDDALLEKFFDAGTLEPDDVLAGLRKGISRGTLFPVLFGSAQKNIGIKVLLDFIAEYLPAPNQVTLAEAVKTDSEEAADYKLDPSGPAIASVFKTTIEEHMGELSFFRVYSGTVKPGMELINQQSRSSERMAQLFAAQGKNRVESAAVHPGDIGVAVKLKHTHTGNTLAVKGADVTIRPTAYPNPVMDVAIRPKAKGDEEKISAGLTRLHEEDPTFSLVSDPALKQQVLNAQGATHIEYLVERLNKRFGVDVDLVKPKIPYRETIMGTSETQYKHKKQSGGRGQYGDVHIRIEPNVRGGGFEFKDEIKGGVIPNKFIPAVEKGVVEQMQHGGLCGAQIVDVKVALFFGSYHDVDSSDMAFKIAGSQAFRKGFLDCKPVILEPIYSVEVLVPDDFTGDVMGDLSSRRGKINGMDPEGGSQRIRASVPRAELYKYSVDLRSMTQGQGVFTMEFEKYEPVPHETAQKVIAEAKAEQESE